MSGFSIESSAGPDSTYVAGDTILLKVTFSAGFVDDGNGDGTGAAISVNIGTRTRVAYGNIGPGCPTVGNIRCFVMGYIVQLEDEDADGISIASNAQNAANAYIVDTNGNPVPSDSLLLGTHAISNAAAHKVDGDLGLAKVTGVSITSDAGADSTYVLGQTISASVTFDSTVVVAGTPQLAIEIGTDTVQANYATGTGSSTLVFRHVVVATNSDANGVSIAANALTVSAADTIRVTSSGKSALLGLGTHAITNAGAHKVDGSLAAPQVSALTIGAPAVGDTFERGETIEIELAFSSAVDVTGTPQLALGIGSATRQADYASGTGTDTLVFRYTVASGDTDTDGLSIATGALALNGGTIRLAGNTPDATLGLGALAVTNSTPHKVAGDTFTTPAVSDVTITSDAGTDSTYVLGDQIEVEVAFGRPVDVTGSPELALTIGTTTRQASYASASSVADTLVFTYSVGVADADTDGISIGASALALNGATIADLRAGATAANLGLGTHAITNADAHKVDGSLGPPRVVGLSVSAPPSAGTFERGDTITVEVTFNVAVDVTGTPQLALTIASGTRQAAYASGSGTTVLTFVYEVVQADVDTDGFDIGANALSLNSGTIRVSGGTTNAVLSLELHTYNGGSNRRVAGGTFTPSAVQDMSFTSTPAGGSTYGLSEQIEVSVEFYRHVTVTGSPQLALTIGTQTRQATYAAASSSSRALVFRYSVASSDSDGNGISVGAGALSLNGGTIVDARDGTSSASLGLGSHAISDDADHQVDGSIGPPGVSGVSITSPLFGDTFERGDSIFVMVTFNKAVDVTGAPRLALTIGSTTRQAAYLSGTGTASLMFGYEVVTADVDNDGLSIGASALTLNSGTIDVAGGTVDAELGLGTHAITNSSGHKVAGNTFTAASVSGASITSTPSLATTYGRGEQIEVRLTFNRRVTVTTTGGTPQVALTIGTQTRQAAYAGGTGTMSLLFHYTVVQADADADGIEIGASALTLNSGTINDARTGGTAASLGLGSHAIGTASGHKVDGTLAGASVTGAEVWSAPARADNTYSLGERIEARVTFDRAVTVTGTPRLELTIGTTARQASYVAGSGTATLRFEYWVQGAGSGGSGTGGVDVDTDGIGVPANGLTLNGGTILNTLDGARPAVLNLGSFAITASPNDKVDGTIEVAPVVTSLTVLSRPDANGLYGARSTIQVQVVFSSPVEVVGAAQLAIEIGSLTRQAQYASGSGTRVLVFEYLVQPSDRDSDGISIRAGALTAADGAVRLMSSSTQGGHANLFLYDFHLIENLEGHEVNGAGGTDPVFGKIEYDFTLTEDVPGPVVVGQTSATDPLGGGVTYSLSAGGEGLFEVDAETGTITYVGTGEDAEVRSEFVMTVRATSDDGDERTGEAAVTVRLLNVNDPPAFTAKRYDFGFSENEAGPLALGVAKAVDLDEGDTLTYSMTSGDSDRFELDAETGELRYVGAGEDYDGAGPKAWELTVEATDLAGLSATALVMVKLSNVNESPAFADSAYAFVLAENAPGPLSLGTVRATDPDRGDWLSYALAEGDAERFKVNATNGTVQYVGAGEDAETGPDGWTLAITATDRGGLTARTRVVVTLEDRNERPTFAAPKYEWELAEHVPGPVTLGAVEATDVDAGDTLVYRLSGTGAQLFAVDESSGVVHYVGTGEDAETGPESWQFEVVATDRGGLAAVTKATVRLLDVNEAPTFGKSAYAFELTENVGGPRELGHVEATDPDRNETLTYSLASGDAARFQVDRATGAVRYVGAGEDYEASPPTFALAVRVTDSGGLTAEAQVVVALLNVNEGPAPMGALTPPALEASGAPWEVDLAAYFHDPDGDALTYAAESSSPSVASATVTGAGRLSVRPGQIGTAVVTVTASDPGGLSATQQATVTVDGSRTERARALKLTLAAFGRSLGTETVDAISGRLGLGSRQSGSAVGRSHVQLGGRSLTCASFSGSANEPASSKGQCDHESLLRDASGLLGFQLTHPGTGSGPYGGRSGTPGGTLDLATLLFGNHDAGMSGPAVATGDFGSNGFGASSSHQGLNPREPGDVSLNPITGRDIRSASSFQLSSMSGWTLWGQSNYGEFEGRPDEGFSMDGRTYSIYAGLDYRLVSGFLVGLAGSRSDLAANYESAINGASTVDAHLNSLYPYASWSSDDGLGVWGVVGAGRGAAVLGEQNRGFHAVLNMRMGALGVRQELTGGLALKADAFAVRMNTAESPGGVIAPVTASAQRVRLAPELARQWTVGEGLAVRTQVELGARYDGGDAETGMGAEAGGEFGLTHQATGVSLAARGRALLIHQDSNFKDWGAAVSLRIQPGRSDAEAGGGLSFLLEPSWGNASGSAQTLWQGGEDMWRTAGVGSTGSAVQVQGSSDALSSATSPAWTPNWTPDRLSMEVGYGVLLPNGAQLKPFGRWSRKGPAGYRLNVGTQWALLDAPEPNPSAALGEPGFRNFNLHLDLFGEELSDGLQPKQRRLGLAGRIGFN